jgi:hypothetical protein
MSTRKNHHRTLIKKNEGMQLKAVKAQNRTLMQALSNRTTSWQKAVADNEKLQLKQIRQQNEKLIGTLKHAKVSNSAAKHRMMVQLNADRVQNKILYKTLRANPNSWRGAVNRRLRTQLNAVRTQDNAIM